MKLKSLLIFAGLLASSSCTNAGFPFRVDRIFPLSPGCDVGTADEIITTQGYLDVAAGSPQFFVGVRVVGAEQIKQQPVAVGSTQLELENRNRPVIQQQVVSYRLSKRVGPTPKPYLTNRTASFSQAGTVIMSLQLISPELGAALFDGLTPSDGFDDFVDIEVDVEFRGEFNASQAPFTTGALTYPIRAYRSNPTLDCMNRGFVKFNVDPISAAPDFCSYVGMGYESSAPPPPAKCCTAVGPSGGPGC